MTSILRRVGEVGLDLELVDGRELLDGLLELVLADVHRRHVAGDGR